MTRSFTAVDAQHDAWWIGWLEDLPGATAEVWTLGAPRCRCVRDTRSQRWPAAGHRCRSTHAFRKGHVYEHSHL